ncbi:transcriptional regulator CadC [Pantoea deleyi]|uniref:CadC family transcriptional regulator n=1 Tax=Pantoea deleyi TaxID=470932 RepID=A0A506PSI2_9GAMM|nr:lysine decarboxylation/transport transcriptional activator CadC [Pantoea deleyi]ORM82138.1 transcriptional regulator CadC [Pantoea deleyi]TPV36232.1 CadC family transcriptional regulator [Pantoea deleyi]
MQQPVVRIGEWLVTPSVNQISRHGRQLTLEPRLIDLLVYFAQHPDEVLSRDEMIENIWTRNIVTNHVVTQSISELRKSLKDGDASSPEYIVTVPKRGYKLTAEVIWCTEEADGVQPPPLTRLHPIAHSVPAEGALSAPPAVTAPAEAEPKRRRTTLLWVWSVFLLALGSCVALVALSTLNAHPPVMKTRIMLNPRDIDVRLVESNSCSNWTSQRAYAVGLGSLITTSLNTFSTYLVHDKTNYNVNEPGSSGKTLTIEFVNQHHYRTQQCFMSVHFVDNADGITMFDKRYFVTNDNQVSIQIDLMNSLSQVLAQPWPPRMQAMLRQYQPEQSPALAQFYQAHQLLMNGDADSLSKASNRLDEIIRQAPDFTYAQVEKALVEALRRTQQQPDSQSQTAFDKQLDALSKIPEIKQTSGYYQVRTLEKLGLGQVSEAFSAINSAIDLEMSWMNYVLLGKVYEMKGENRLAADAYITAFNLRPGANTLYWIENSVFQTSVSRVVPYLDNFLSQE